MAFITIRHPDNKIENIVLEPGKELSLGRASTNEIAFPKDAKISSKHCKIYYSPEIEQYVLSDLRSTNGTILNMNRISADVSLSDNDKIRIGDIRLLFRSGTLNEATTTTTKKVLRLAATKNDEKEQRTDTCIIPNFANIKRKPKLTMMNDFSLTQGEKVGEYQIVRKLADFQFGGVYSAMSPSFQGAVALKIFSLAFDVHHPGLDDFNNCLFKLQHFSNPYFVKTVGGGSHLGHCYQVMDMVSVEDLNMKIAKHAPFPEYEAITIVYTVAAALESAFAGSDIIHGMLSPSSVLIDAEDNLMIKGHGLAHWMTKHISGGKPISLPWYASPEQAMQASFDWSADLYSLGVIFFQLLTGEVPYHSPSDREILDMHLKEPLPNPLETNPNISMCAGTLELLAKMTAKNPKDRFRSWPELLQALEELSANLETTDPEPHPQDEPERQWASSPPQPRQRDLD